MLSKAPKTKLFVTGQSLGGALSVLFGIRLALKNPKRNVQVINFGCPKVGNAAFAQLVNNTENLCVQRVAHKNDIFTRGPNLGYSHVGHTIHAIITEVRVGGRVGNPRGLIVNVVPGPRGAQMSPDPGPTPGRLVAG